MQIADALILDAPRRTADGFMAVRAKAAKAGVYDYLASEVGAPQTFKGTDTVKVYRDAAEVFAADSVRSFIGRPITNDHPSEAVTASNWRDHARGTVMGAMRDGEYLAFDLVLMDAAAIQAVEDGKRELSNGYQCSLDWTPGTAPDGTAYDARQTGIKGNHVALVDKGRAGPNCAIKDGDRFAACDAATPSFLDSLKEKPVKTMLIDGLTVDIANADTALATITTILAARDAATVKVTGLESKAVADAATIVAKDAEIVKLTADLAAAKPTLQQLRDAGKAFAVIEAKAKAMGVPVTDAMDEAAIMKAVVDKAMPGNTYAADHIAIAFDALTKDAKVGDGATIHNIAPAQMADGRAEVATARAAWLADKATAYRATA